MAQLTLGVAGAVGGFFVGGPAGASYGFAIGSTLGGALFPQKLPDAVGPRLNDLKVTSSAFGKAIPVVYGTIRIAGNIIWSSDIIETEHVDEAGGKGGPTQEQHSFTYSVHVAIGLCEGEISGIRKIWANQKLVYNVADTANIETIFESQTVSERMTVYPGSETQLPDPLIESYKGAGQVPGYRGLAYIVFESLQLADYGNQVPNFEFEVVKAGSITFAKKTSFDLLNSPVINNSIRGDYEAATFADSSGIYLYTFDSSNPLSGTNILAGLQLFKEWFLPHGLQEPIYQRSVSINKEFTFSTSNAPIPNGRSDTRGFFTLDRSLVYWVGEDFTVTQLILPSNIGTWVSGWAKRGNNLWFYSEEPFSNGELYSANLTSKSVHVIPNFGQIGNYQNLEITENYVYVVCVIAGSKRMAKFDRFSEQLIGTYPISSKLDTLSGITAVKDEVFYCAKTVNSDSAAGDSIYLIGGVENLGTAAGEVRIGSISNNPTFLSQSGNYLWQLFAYDHGIIISYGIPGYHRIGYWLTNLISLTVGLSSIVSNLCGKAGLIEINASSLTDQVDGYVIASRTTVRAPIEQLQAAYYFDAIESDYTVKFQKRPAAVVATIPEQELAARLYGSEPPDTVNEVRQLEYELPEQINVVYINKDFAYQQGQQQAKRQITSSRLATTIELPIVMSDAKAKEIAEANMYGIWTSRTTFSFSTTLAYSYLDPGDVINIARDSGRIYKVRITKKEDSGVILKFDAVEEDATVYTQIAPGGIALTQEDLISARGPTLLELMDIPILRDADDDAGFYAAATGYMEGWNGSVLYKSSDEGASYDRTEALTVAATIGSTTTALGNWLGGNVFDESNVVTVKLVSGALNSVTRDEVLANANGCVIGNEILQFTTATQTATDTYMISGLLRGRKGTEWAMGAHVSGERFVLLSEDWIRRIEGATNEINLTRIYKPVTIGKSIQSTFPKYFTNTGAGLKPYSPVHIKFIDNTISWKRRTRISGEWRDLSDVPLGEATEKYEVDVVLGGIVKRKLSTTTPSVAYATADQLTDFGIGIWSVTFNVYQISDTVGRGFPGSLTTSLTVYPDTGASTPAESILVDSTLPQSYPLPILWDGIRFLGGDSLASLGYSGAVIYSSTNGSTWTKNTGKSNIGTGKISSSGTVYVGIGNGWVSRSTNLGVDWTRYFQEDIYNQTLLGKPVTVNFWDNSKSRFTALSQGKTFFSSDALIWTNVNNNLPNKVSIFQVAYSPTLNMYIAVGSQTTTPAQQYGPDSHVCKVYSSLDLITFTDRTPFTLNPSYLFDVVWANGRFVTVGDKPGSFFARLPFGLYSTNGTSWTEISFGTIRQAVLSHVDYVGANYVIFSAANNTLRLYSADAITWTQVDDGYVYDYLVSSGTVAVGTRYKVVPGQTVQIRNSVTQVLETYTSAPTFIENNVVRSTDGVTWTVV